jgi:hypothetical protein
MIFLHGGTGESFPYTLGSEPLSQLPYSQIFPSYSSAQPSISRDSPLARIKEKRVQLRAMNLNGGN